MDLNTLRDTWKKSDTYTTEAASTLWNSRAENFGKKKLPSFEDDHFLQLIEQRIALTPKIATLDIGCGTGAYSLALAPRVGKAVGSDVADKMIEIAASRAQEEGVDNVKFFSADWQTADIDQLEYRKSFDIVFARMTPAVDDFITLDKMVACARKHCFMRKPARRTDRVLDPALELLGISRQNRGSTDTMEYIFSYLWHMGFEPQYHYEKGIIENDKTIQEALD
jgi:SAM-dependent methyltransferase